jgi:error-prone DNA polymerase
MSISMIGIDTAKSTFQLHGIDATGKVQLKRKLRRDELIAFFERQPRCTVVMEACGAAHHWARVLSGIGFEVRLIASEAVKPFVKRGKKNDPADAAAICAAASRPEAKFVAVKSLEQQGVLALHSARSLLVKQETMLANAMRGLATEFGLVVPKGMDKLEELWRWWRRTRAFRSRHAKRSLNCASTVAPRRSGSRAWSGDRRARSARRHGSAPGHDPGIGPITASLTAATVGDSIGDFPSARPFRGLAWVGAAPALQRWQDPPWPDHQGGQPGDPDVAGARRHLDGAPRRAVEQRRGGVGARAAGAASCSACDRWRWPTRWRASPGR